MLKEYIMASQIKCENKCLSQNNLDIIKYWLDKYGNTLDLIHQADEIDTQFQKLEKMDIDKIQKYDFLTNMKDSTPEEIQTKCKEYGIPQYFIHTNTQSQQDLIKKFCVTIPSKEDYELYKNKDIIKEKYDSLQSEKHDIDTKLQNAQFTNGNRPSYFMKEYIQATHNLFLMQNERIDKLERMIKEHMV